MTKKHPLWLFIPILILTSGMLIYLIYQYKPLFPNDLKYQKAKEIKNFHIPILIDDPIFGNPNSTSTIIIFSEYNCSECKKQLTFFQNLLKKYPNEIKLIWKNILLNDFDKNKTLAHKYAYCASEQEQFWTFQMYAFENEKTFSSSTLNAIANNLEINTKKFEKCLNSQDVNNYIERNRLTAQILNIKNFPTIFLNNKQIYSTEELTTKLDTLFGNK